MIVRRKNEVKQFQLLANLMSTYPSLSTKHIEEKYSQPDFILKRLEKLSSPSFLWPVIGIDPSLISKTIGIDPFFISYTIGIAQSIIEPTVLTFGIMELVMDSFARDNASWPFWPIVAYSFSFL